MNEAIAFDTHRYVKRLIASGFSELQAETLAEEQIEFLNANLATKADVAQIHADIDALRQETKAGIETLRQETKAGIETLRQETKADNSRLKAELIKWAFAALIAQSGLIITAVKLL